MKTITASELHQHLYEYLVQAQEDEIIVTLDNGALVRLSAIEEEDLIDDTLESDPRFIQLINARREHYQRSGGVSLATVQAALIDELIRDLEDADPHVRFEAARHLVEMGGRVIRPLVDHYYNYFRDAADNHEAHLLARSGEPPYFGQMTDVPMIPPFIGQELATEVLVAIVLPDPDYDLTELEDQLGDAAVGNSVGRRMINRIIFLASSSLGST